MQRRPRRSDPARIGVRVPEPLLLGVGAIGGVDHQRHSGAAGGRRHAVEGDRDVRSHRLALPVGERTGVAAALGHRRLPGAGRGSKRHLGLRVRRRGRIRARGPSVRAPDPDLPADLHPDLQGSERSPVREADLDEIARRGRCALPPLVAATRARSRYSARSRWAGFGAPPGSRAGRKRRSKSSRIDRAAEIAARSAERCRRPLAVAAPPIATRIRASATIRIAIPRTAGSAWAPSARSRTAAAGCRPTPRIASNAEARRAARRAVSPPGSRPASARRAPTGPIAGTQTFTGMPSARSSAASSAISGRSEPRVAFNRTDRRGLIRAAINPRKSGGSQTATTSPTPRLRREQVAEQLRPLRPRRLAGRGQEADPPAGGRAKAGMLTAQGFDRAGPRRCQHRPPQRPRRAPQVDQRHPGFGSPSSPSARRDGQRRGHRRNAARRTDRGADDEARVPGLHQPPSGRA